MVLRSKNVYVSTSFDTNIDSCSQNDFIFTSSHIIIALGLVPNIQILFCSKIKASSDNIPLKISSPCLVYFPSISKKSKLRVDKGMWLSKGTYKGVGSYHCIIGHAMEYVCVR